MTVPMGRIAALERLAEAKRSPWAYLRPDIEAALADKLEAGGLTSLTDAELEALEHHLVELVAEAART